MLPFAIISERSAFVKSDWAHLQPGQKDPRESGGAEQALHGDSLPLAFGAMNVLHSQVKLGLKYGAPCFKQGSVDS